MFCKDTLNLQCTNQSHYYWNMLFFPAFPSKQIVACGPNLMCWNSWVFFFYNFSYYTCNHCPPVLFVAIISPESASHIFLFYLKISKSLRAIPQYHVKMLRKPIVCFSHHEYLHTLKAEQTTTQFNLKESHNSPHSRFTL